MEETHDVSSFCFSFLSFVSFFLLFSLDFWFFSYPLCNTLILNICNSLKFIIIKLDYGHIINGGKTIVYKLNNISCCIYATHISFIV